MLIFLFCGNFPDFHFGDGLVHLVLVLFLALLILGDGVLIVKDGNFLLDGPEHGDGLVDLD